MPPKKAKKVDPAVLKKQYEEWQITEEFKEWYNLLQKKKDFPGITETSEDLTGKWQEFHDGLFSLAMKFKVKTKLKEFKHEHIRGCFFGREDKPDQHETIDGIVKGVRKDYSDPCWHARRKFIEIWNLLDMINDSDFETKFKTVRTNMSKALSELAKLITTYSKQSHKEVYEERLVGKLLKPLIDLMITNTRLSLFEFHYDDPEKRQVALFKEKALTEEFCENFQACLEILHEKEKDKDKRIIANPNVRRIFNKLGYTDWDKNIIEKFYLMPLKEFFYKMRSRLLKFHFKGIDFWMVPLSSNKDFLDDVRQVVDAELIAEHLLGDELKRDQLNFIYNSLKIIMNTPFKPSMLKKDPSFIKTSIPELIIFLTLQEMRKIMDNKIKDQEDIAKERAKGWPAASFAEMEASENPPPKKNVKPDLEEEKRKLEEAERKRYGRFWLWENYIQDQRKEELLEGADMLKHINIAVQQDIQDYLITEGLMPQLSKEDREKKENKELLKEKRNFLKKLKENDSNKEENNKKRPPLLWNHPDIIDQEHEYRSIAAPYECYQDPRVKDLLKIVSDLGRHILSNKDKHWMELVNRTIDVFNNEYKNKPTPLGD